MEMQRDLGSTKVGSSTDDPFEAQTSNPRSSASVPPGAIFIHCKKMKAKASITKRV